MTRRSARCRLTAGGLVPPEPVGPWSLQLWPFPGRAGGVVRQGAEIQLPPPPPCPPLGGLRPSWARDGPLAVGLVISEPGSFHSRQGLAPLSEPLGKSSLGLSDTLPLLSACSLSSGCALTRACVSSVSPSSTLPSVRGSTFSSPNLCLVHGTVLSLFVLSFFFF